MKITYDGKELSFREFMTYSGGEHIYDENIKDIFLDWKYTDFAVVDDYIAPIAAEVIVRAFDTEPELYQRIMTVIEETYLTMNPEDAPKRPHLTLINGSKGRRHEAD